MKERRIMNIKWKRLLLTRAEYESFFIAHLIFWGVIIQSLISAKMIVGLITCICSKAGILADLRSWFLVFDLLYSGMVIYIVACKKSIYFKVYDGIRKYLRLVIGKGRI